MSPHSATPAVPRLTRRRALRLYSHRGATPSDETGAATAEYAIATMAAVAFAGLLVVIMQSDEVRGMLENIIRTALTLDE